MSELSYPAMVSVDGGNLLHGTLTITHEYERIVSSSPEPDRRWSYVDAAGHFHAYDQKWEDNLYNQAYPTLRPNSRHMGCNGLCPDPDSGCEGWDDVYYTCIACDEEIEPKTVPGPHSRSIHTSTTWELEVAAAVPSTGKVSVRIEQNERTWFGFAVVSWYEAGSTEGRSMFIGVTPLGKRKD